MFLLLWASFQQPPLTPTQTHLLSDQLSGKYLFRFIFCETHPDAPRKGLSWAALGVRGPQPSGAQGSGSRRRSGRCTTPHSAGPAHSHTPAAGAEFNPSERVGGPPWAVGRLGDLPHPPTAANSVRHRRRTSGGKQNRHHPGQGEGGGGDGGAPAHMGPPGGVRCAGRLLFVGTPGGGWGGWVRPRQLAMS